MRQALPFLIISACGAGGALEQAQLEGECGGSSTACLDELSAGPLAVGGTVMTAIKVDTAGSGTAVLELEAANADVLEITGHQLTGLDAGMSAVIVTETTTGSVIDFFHVYVAEPDRLELMRLGGIGAGPDLAGDIGLLPGDEITVGAVAYRGPQRLVGVGDVAWTLDGDDAVSLLSDGNPDRRRIVARRAGTTFLSIDSMGMSQTLAITVQP